MIAAYHRGVQQLTENRLRAGHEEEVHQDIGCPIHDCRLRFSPADKMRMNRHRNVHHLIREQGTPEPKDWTEAPQCKDLEGKGDVQGTIPTLPVGAGSDSTLGTDSLGVVDVTEFLVEHTNSE